MENGLDEQYIELLKDILENGVEKDTRNGKTLSVFGKTIRYKFKDGKFPLLTTKKMYFKGVATELIWFLRGDTNIKFLLENDCNIWTGDAYKNYSNKVQPWEPHLDEKMFVDRIKTDNEFAKKWGELGPIYGKQWRSWEWNTWPGYQPAHTKRIDQIQNLINDLKTNPDSRRLLVTAWNPSDLPHQVLPPCHYGFQVYTRELTIEERLDLASKTYKVFDPFDFNEVTHEEINKLYTVPKRAISLMWNQRSVDTFLGLPFNIASYGLLLEIIAKAVGMVPDELIGNLGDCHLYLNHVEHAQEQIVRDPMPLCRLNINTEWWPKESEEFEEGLLDASAIFKEFSNDKFCRCLLEEDLQLANYKSHPAIKAPLSN